MLALTRCKQRDRATDTLSKPTTHMKKRNGSTKPPFTRVEAPKTLSVAAHLLQFLRAKWDLVLFCAGVLAFTFAAGILVERNRLFPYDLIEGAVAAQQDWRANWRHYLQIRSKFLVPTPEPNAA